VNRLLTSLLLVLAFGCVQPNVPGVGPNPPAPADDVKRAAVLKVVTVDDFKDRTPERVAVLDKLSRGVPPHKFREYDVANPEWKRWQSQVDAAGGPPCAFFLDLKTLQPVGKPMRMPAKFEDLQSAIDRYTVKP